MKKIIIIFLVIFLTSLFFVSCSKPADEQKEPLYKTYEDPELSDLFVSATDKSTLLSEEDFLNKTKNSTYIQYGDVIPYDKFIELVGKPQREVLYIGPDEANLRFSEPFPKIRNFEWALKDNKTIIYTVVLSDECQDSSANSDNIMKFGLVFNISSNKAVE